MISSINLGFKTILIIFAFFVYLALIALNLRQINGNENMNLIRLFCILIFHKYFLPLAQEKRLLQDVLSKHPHCFWSHQKMQYPAQKQILKIKIINHNNATNFIIVNIATTINKIITFTRTITNINTNIREKTITITTDIVLLMCHSY